MDLSTSYTIKAQVTGQNEIGGLTKGLGKLQKTRRGFIVLVR